MQIQINDLLPYTRMKESNFYTPAILKFMCSYFRILMNTLQTTAAKMCKGRYLLKIGQEEVKAVLGRTICSFSVFIFVVEQILHRGRLML